MRQPVAHTPESSTQPYTYADYLRWGDNTRCELYNGIVNEMLPAPSRRHQEVSGNLFFQFKRFLRGNPCKVYHAPFDVRLPKSAGDTADDEIYTVVQPDIVVVCDPQKLDERGCIGAPDLIVEILSPSNSKNDVDDKFTLYQEAGVRAYWIVHPLEETLIVYHLDQQGKLAYQHIYSNMSQVQVGIFDGIIIDLQEVFQS